MGRLLSVLMFPVSCLILLWVAGSGSMRVLQDPTCFSDYISISTCEWEMAGPTNCRAELHLSYQLNFYYSEKNTCVPENRGGVGGAVCTCHMQIDNPVREDIYQLDLWAGGQLLWNSSFKPSEHVKPLAPRNLTVHADISHTWLLTWNNPYPSDNLLCSELTYLVNVSNENDPTDVRIYNVTYVGPTLRVVASTLKSGASYSARVKAWAQSYNSTWSEWSPSIKWLNCCLLQTSSCPSPKRNGRLPQGEHFMHLLSGSKNLSSPGGLPLASHQPGPSHGLSQPQGRKGIQMPGKGSSLGP